MASPPASPLLPASLAAPPAVLLLPRSPPRAPLSAIDYSEGMHLAPGYKEFLRDLITNGGELLAVHRAAWRRAFPDEAVPPTVPFRHNGDPGVEVEDAVMSVEAEELSDDDPPSEGGFSDDEGAGGDGSSEEEDGRPLQRRRLL